MARCLRCKAGNEWIEGDVKPEPSEPSHALLKGEPSDLVKRIRAYSYVDAQAVEDLQDDVLRLHREKMDLLYGPDGFPRSNALPNTVPNTDVALRAAVHLLKRVIGPSFFDNSLQGQIESFLRGQGESFTTGLPSAPSTTARSGETPRTDALLTAMLHGDGIPRCKEWEALEAHAYKLESELVGAKALWQECHDRLFSTPSATACREPTEDDLNIIESDLGMAKAGWGDVNGLEIVRACWRRYAAR